MKRMLLLCNCQGTCPSFQQMNVFEVVNALRREGVVDAVAIHPQLCAEDGDTFLQALLQGTDIEVLAVAACDPVMQKKMFRDAFEASGFDRSRHRGVDIRNMTTEQAVDAIKRLLEDNGPQGQAG